MSESAHDCPDTTLRRQAAAVVRAAGLLAGRSSFVLDSVLSALAAAETSANISCGLGRLVGAEQEKASLAAYLRLHGYITATGALLELTPVGAALAAVALPAPIERALVARIERQRDC